MAKDVSKECCKKAKKLMVQVERLGEKTSGNLSTKKIAQLREKLTDGSLIWSDLPGLLQRNFPGELKGLTWSEIKDRCKRAGINLGR